MGGKGQVGGCGSGCILLLGEVGEAARIIPLRPDALDVGAVTRTWPRPRSERTLKQLTTTEQSISAYMSSRSRSFQ